MNHLGTGMNGSFARKRAIHPRPQVVHSSPSPSGSVTVWHSLFHLSYIYDNVVYERYAKNIKYQNLSKKESK